MVVGASLELICFRLVLKGDLEDLADAIFQQAFRSQMFINNPHEYDLIYRSDQNKLFETSKHAQIT